MKHVGILNSAEASDGFTRRNFLTTLAAGAAFGGCRSMGVFEERPILTVGLASDPHLDARYPHRAQLLAQAFGRMREAKVDAVVVAGDLTDRGLTGDLRTFAETWQGAFPGGCGISGEHVELFAVYGNRDLMCSRATDEAFRSAHASEAIRTDPFAAWRMCFGEEEANRRLFRTVRGIPFFGLDWGDERGDVAGVLAKHRAEIDPSKPFFLIQHPPPNGTCFSIWGDEAPSDPTAKALSPYRNAIALSGHSHLSIADDTCVWHGAFTSVACGSTWNAVSRDDVPPPAFQTQSQYALMRVFGDHIVLSRHDVATGRRLGADIIWSSPDPNRSGSFRFACWNVGHYSWGRESESTVTSYEAKRVGRDYRRFIEALATDVLGVAEYSGRFCQDGDLRADTAVFRRYSHQVVGSANGYQCNALFFRRFRLLDRRERPYPAHRQKTYYEAVKLDVFGRGVWFVMTHLDFGDAAVAEMREKQMRMIVADFADEPRVVIGGDFNVTEIRPDGTRRFTVGQYDIFRQAGYQAANDGSVATAKRGAPLDNIFVRGLEMSEVAFHPAGDLSDHSAVSCTLR